MLAWEETVMDRVVLIEKSLSLSHLFRGITAHTRNAQQKEISITGDDPGNWNRNWNREWSVTYELSIPRCLSSLGSSNLIWNLGNHFIRNLGSFRSPFPRIFLVSLSLSRDLFARFAFDANATRPDGRAQLTFVSALTKWKVEELEN